MAYNKEIQQRIIEEVKTLPEVNPSQEIYERVQFLRSFLRETGLNGFVLGLSGGQDSTLSGRLAQTAVSLEGKRFVAMKLPYGVQKDAEDVELAIDFIKPDNVFNLNIKPIVDAFCIEYERATGEPLTDYHKGNVKARIRMVAQYAVAGMQELAVLGTDHASENCTRFYTKFGDGAADILPIFGLTKFQGAELLKTLDSPERFYQKTPSPDLLDNTPCRPDEDELGFTYQDIENFLTGKEVCDEVFDKIYAFYLKGDHKTKPPITIYDSIKQG
ncbi:ammonia-dependent NAD(+) synthetase [Sporomusa malonica]|uniref:NH(3)-dependent NAD(+) synthetase n=1 Tax=Sporomusa malonica TaxID=112901 RepID=A0A1W1Z9Q9_9FIRM|nr:ammonia-dependent NAD(+) synthetase [Sporomusa malonica]SMC45134.1 NH(3)-dependent NAD(+) synthetase [Sporomusa malonica]